MPLSNKRSDTFLPLLQDLQQKLGDNYTFYQECVVAIASAAADQQDASAWYEQMELVVERVEEAQNSHAGVTFLLREMERGEVTPKREMPPPPLPPHLQQPPQQPSQMEPQRSPAVRGLSDFAFTPSPAAPSPALSASSFAFDIPSPLPSSSASGPKAPNSQSVRGEKPASPFTIPHNDPIFFTDPTLSSSIATFFNITTPTPTTAGYDVRAQHPFNYESSYNFAEDFGVRYDPAADDLETFMNYEKWEEQEAMESEKTEMKQREKATMEKSSEEVIVLSQPITTNPHKVAKGKKAGKKRGRWEVAE